MSSLHGKVCLVTGATRGIGKGIALQLGEAGATVYISGRTLKPKNDSIGGSLEETAKEIEERGGTCIPVQCDHSKDEQIEALFDQINREQSGQLDILVNNAFAGFNTVLSNLSKKFWEMTPTVWDDINGVGLRNHYICSCHGAKMMTARKQGLIVNVSSFGGLQYALSVAYGVGKEALDRMTADCAIELKKHNVACVCLWPGGVRTERMKDLQENTAGSIIPEYVLNLGESQEYAGKCVVHLAADKNIMSKTGKVLISRDVGDQYGFLDIDGRNPLHQRSIRYALHFFGWHRIADWCPEWLKTPKVLIGMATIKF